MQRCGCVLGGGLLSSVEDGNGVTKQSTKYVMATFLECGRKDNKTSWNTVALYAQGVT